MNQKEKIEYNLLKELQNKAAINYCLNKLLSEYMPSDSFETCYSCNLKLDKQCKGYEDLGYIPTDIFVDIYRLCLEQKLKDFDECKSNRLTISKSKLERDVM